ncbi:MAG: MFS transporter [Anaerolineae bacterium]|nr:MFS transporter [Anaerolineae bacterium]
MAQPKRIYSECLVRNWSRLRYYVRGTQISQRMRDSIRKPFVRTSREQNRLLRKEIDQNIRYLYLDVFWAAIFMAVMAFNVTYALRLGASNQMIGWLSSIPSLFAMLMMLPSARFLERRKNQSLWINRSLLIGRFLFLGVALVPWIFRRYQAELVIWILILRSIPMNFFSAGFSPLLARAIPARDRARVLGNRSIINSAVVAVSTYLLGIWLDAGGKISWANFPLNYQVMYILGAAAALVSVYYVSRLSVPQQEVKQTQDKPNKKQKISLIKAVADFRQSTKDNRAFVRMVINTLVFNLGAWFVMSLYTIFFVKELQASDGWVGLNTTLANIGVIAGNLLWRRIIAKVGDQRALLLSLPLSASYAFLVALFPNLSWILVWGILINLVNPGVNLSHYNILVDSCPEDRMASYLAIFSTIMNVGAFVSPMLGIALSELIGVTWVLIIGGSIRLFGALLFFIWKVDEKQAPGQSLALTG